MEGSKRNLIEIAFYSADVRSYLTASQHLPVWGRLQAFPRAEGNLFPGRAVIVLSAIAITAGLAAGTWRRRTDPARVDAAKDVSRARRVATVGGTLLMAVSLLALAWVIVTGGQLPEDRQERARLDVIIQQQVDRATRRVAERGYQAGPFRGAMEGFAWEKFDPLYLDRSLKMVAARVFEHIDPNEPDAVDRAAEALRAQGILVERDGVDRLRFSDGSVVDVLRNAAVAAGVPDATVSWMWLVTEKPSPVIAPWLLGGLVSVS